MNDFPPVQLPTLVPTRSVVAPPGRSPKYPQHTLAVAESAAKRLISEIGNSPSSFEEICEVWGVAPSSYHAKSRLAALHEYGLLTEVTVTNDEQEQEQLWAVSERVVLLLDPEDEDMFAYLDALQDAALAPRYCQEIWDRYGTYLGECSSSADFLRVGNAIAHYLTTRAEPRFRESGASKLVGISFKNFFHSALLTSQNTDAYFGPFIPMPAGIEGEKMEKREDKKKPLMTLFEDSEGDLIFELHIREKITRATLEGVHRVVAAMQPFLAAREKERGEP